jgi:hypothetical protein
MLHLTNTSYCPRNVHPGMGPFAIPTSICRSNVTNDSGLFLLMDITSLLSHSAWTKSLTGQANSPETVWQIGQPTFEYSRARESAVYPREA